MGYMHHPCTHSNATVIDAASEITAAFIVIEAHSEVPVE